MSQTGTRAFLLPPSAPQIVIPALIVITQVTHNFPVFVVMVIMAGCSLAVLYLLPW